MLHISRCVMTNKHNDLSPTTLTLFCEELLTQTFSCPAMMSYTGWPIKNALGLETCPFILARDRYRMICKHVEQSMLRWPLKFRVDRPSVNTNYGVIWKCLLNVCFLSRNPDLTMHSSSNKKFLLSGKCSTCILVLILVRHSHDSLTMNLQSVF